MNGIKEEALKRAGKSPHNVGCIKLTEKEASLMKYLLAYQTKSQMHLIREQIVKYADENGNKAATEEFECHRNTVSKWKGRYKQEGSEGLKNLSRAPHNIPHKIIDEEVIKEILDKRDEKGYGANRLKMQFGLKPSNNAINRILHEGDKIDKPVKKEQKKNDLWHIKRFFKTLETKCQMDAKCLTDIPNYYVHQKLFGLPKWQFSFRDVKSGATFIGYMDTEDGLNACTFIVYVFEHLSNYGIRPKELTVQTDGASYAMNLKSLKKTAFQELVEDIYGAKLKIKVKGGKKQSDVETFHKLIEDEFYKRKTFKSKEHFYAEAYEYIYDFNFVRLNSHKDWKAPIYFLNQDKPDVSRQALDLPPVKLEEHIDLYLAKLDPKHITTEEIELLDIKPEELEKLEISDFSHDEYMDEFADRVYEAAKHVSFSAHDLPIQPNYFSV